MNQITGIGLYLSNASNKNLILEQILGNKYLRDYIDLSLHQGALHSTITINRLVEEELRHDRFVITTNENSSLSSMSSGQQKKALLNYLITQKPHFIILDDVYSNIDKETKEAITISLAQLAQSTLLIQIFFRKRDILPCITKILTIDSNNCIVKEETPETFLATDQLIEKNKFSFKLPEEYNEKHLDINPLIQLNSLSVSYVGKPVLVNINWKIEKGEFW